MNKIYLKAMGVRAVKTISQTAVALLGTTMVISEVDWLTVVSASLLAGLLSVLTSLAGLPEVSETTDDDEAEVEMLGEHYTDNRKGDDEI